MTTEFATIARAATLTIVLALPAAGGFAGSALADDEYGTNRSPSILSSAQSDHYANPADTPLARATAAAKVAALAYAANRPSTASDASMASASPDLNGQGGPQDRLGREIYSPGFGTDF